MIFVHPLCNYTETNHLLLMFYQALMYESTCVKEEPKYNQRNRLMQTCFICHLVQLKKNLIVKKHVLFEWKMMRVTCA